ncbi:MAG: 2-hydroxyacyl-CoA dehydratase [Deltaproteobacteria bacterium]|nr:2-hydroxyacyl-CoA dehydratase [Deltaproteobacteria bacterium]
MFDEDYRERIENEQFLEGIELKSQGRPIIGTYCAFTPKEIIAAAGAVAVSLCAGAQRPIPQAEAHLPRNICPLIKSSYGFALTDTCPYFHEVDLIIADTTCDGKKKMFELIKRLKPIFVLSLPQTVDDNGLNYWLTEFHKTKQLLENLSGNSITPEKLADQISLYNRLRQTILAVYSLNTNQSPMLSGKEIFNITFMNTFECNIEKRVSDMKSAIEVAKTRFADDSFKKSLANKPRILLSGCPTTNRKILDIIEKCGGIVVAMENCGGLKPLLPLVAENKEPMLALAEKYLLIPCPCMTPNDRRSVLIGDIVKDYHVDGIIDLTWENCQLYDTEAFLIREKAHQEWKKPYLQIRTDYSENDIGQLMVRVEGFLEIMKADRH